MTERFSADWLSLRERFDATARSPALAARLAAALPPHPRLLDLGAGTGSLFRWLAPRLARPQEWTLADADPTLLARANEAIITWAAARDYPIGAQGQALLVSAPFGLCRVVTQHLDLACALPLDGHDAVVCSALLDLVSADWIDQLADRLHVPMLACLSVDGSDAFLPPHAADTAIRVGFRRDQARDKGLGPALGPRAPAVLHAALAARGFTLASVNSDWRIPRHATAMLAELVEGHTAPAARRLPQHRSAIAAWRAARLRQIAQLRLAIRIGHRDSLALPPN